MNKWWLKDSNFTSMAISSFHKIKFDELQSTSFLLILYFFAQDTCSIFLADLFIQYICIFGNIWQYDIEMRKRTIDNQPGHCKNAVITFVPHHFFLHAKSMYVIFYFHEIASIVGPFFDRTLCISRNLFIWNPWAAAAVQYILLNLFNIC